MIASMQNRIAEFGRRLMGMMTELARTQADFKILSKHLGEDVETAQTVRAPRQWKEIHFDKTRFAFIKDGSIFTHRVDDFTVRRGDHLAVIGKSGEGKTTFLNLLTNQFDVESGAVCVDGGIFPE